VHSSASVSLFKTHLVPWRALRARSHTEKSCKLSITLVFVTLLPFYCAPLRYPFTLCGARFGLSGHVAKNRVPTLLHHVHKNGF
jgi:hypothetical protein